MDSFRLGVVCIVGSEEELLGIITDGDIRRKLLSVQKPLPAFFIDDAINHAITDPITISSNMKQPNHHLNGWLKTRQPQWVQKLNIC